MIELRRRLSYYIDRLNKDFQKVWFGCNAAGEAIDLKDMTYADMMKRMVVLLYVKHQSRWIHESYLVLVADFTHRLEERLCSAIAASQVLMFRSLDDFLNPFSMIETVLSCYPDAETQLISAEDEQFFLSSCRRRGQKPVTFVPVLDEQFETWFKKDSLWQSEDLDGVIHQDVQRTCILHGPVAARRSRTKNVDEPVKDILDRVNDAYIQLSSKDTGRSQDSSIPSIDFFGVKDQEMPNIADYEVYQTRNKITYVLADSAEAKLPSTESWYELLAGEPGTWRHALFRSSSVVQHSGLLVFSWPS